MQRFAMLAALLALAAAPAPAQDASTDLMAAARGHLAARRLDSAAVLFRQVAEAPARAIAERVQAWVLLGLVDFYRSGDSAAAEAFREALALDPAIQVAALDQFDPRLAEIFVAQRAALPAAPAPPAVAAMVDCLRKCPAGVRPPSVSYFPPLLLSDETRVLGPNGLSTYLQIEAVVGVDGRALVGALAGGSARGAEAVVRRGLAQAWFEPGRVGGVPVATRVLLRFDFDAEGQNAIRYRYRIVAR